jgi:Zn-dependent metalloprotease
MYSRQEMARLRESFWTSFGQYMAPVPSAAGQKINWVNYKTGVKDLYVKMQAAQESASIAIVLTHAQPEKQASIYDQLLQLKNLLRDALQEEWQWQQQVKDENNKTISAVYTSINGVNIYRKEDWPAIISFFKPRMVALDAFWTEVKEGFMYL